MGDRCTDLFQKELLGRGFDLLAFLQEILHAFHGGDELAMFHHSRPGLDNVQCRPETCGIFAPRICEVDVVQLRDEHLSRRLAGRGGAVTGLNFIELPAEAWIMTKVVFRLLVELLEYRAYFSSIVGD